MREKRSIKINQQMRRSNPQLIAVVNEPERLARQAVVAPSARLGSDRSTGRVQNTLEQGELMKRLLEEVTDHMDIARGSFVKE